MNVYPEGTSFDRVLDLAQGMGATWVRTTLTWSAMETQRGSYQWEVLDALMAGAAQRGLNILLTVSKSPSWATASANGGLPDNPGDFGTFMGALANRAQGRIAAYEIWQSPNTAAVNSGKVAQPGQYVDLLAAAYQAIKAVNPCTLVLNGALEPTASRDPAIAIDDLTFYRSLLAYQGGTFRKVHDILAIQLNTSGAFDRGKWPRAEPALSRGFYGHAEFIRDEMTAGDESARQAWVVQVGYRIAGDHAIAPQQQGNYLTELFDKSHKAYPWMSGIFVRDLALQETTGDPVDFSLVNPDGTPRPGYGKVKAYFTKQHAAAEHVTPIKGTDSVLLWWFTPYQEATSPLVTGPDSAIYSTSKVGFVFSVDPNGAFRGQTRISKKPVVGVAVDSRQNLYATANDNTIIGLTGGGTILWNELTDGTAVNSLLVSADGQQLYTGNSKEQLDAYSTTDGKKLWGTPLGAIPGNPIVGSDGTIYIGSADGKFHAIAPDGTPHWVYDAGTAVAATPVVSGTTIYGVTTKGAAFALDPNGTQLWRDELGSEGTGVAVGPDGGVYVSTADSNLHALGPDGRQRWVTDLKGGRPTGAAVTTDGTIYIGAADGKLRMITPDGQVAGIFDLQHPLRVAPVAGPNGAITIALPNKNPALVAFGPKDLWTQYHVP